MTVATALAHISPRPLTVDDLYELPEDGWRYELLDGSLLMSPPPRSRHQLVVSRLLRIISAVMPDGLEVIDGVGVRITKRRYFIPDLIIGPSEALTADVQDHPPGVVALAVEVVSKSSVLTDRTTKPAAYARAGIPRYLRVELDGAHAPHVHLYRLKGKAYVEHATAHAGQTFEMDEPVRLSFDPARLIGF